ncbi:MAG: hypothetical protein JWN70_3284 [Planctomycetaceae bacterium]|nr:hypothetical protein [Planctomycetaceae bacterium]
MRLFVSIALVLFGVSFAVAWGAPGDEDPPVNPYDSLWQQVRQLLADREFGSAAGLIEDAEDDPEFAPFKKQLVTDRKDLAELQRFATLVNESAAGLKSGATLKQGSSTYTVEKYISDAEGDRLLLKGPNSATAAENSLNELEYHSWIDLTQSKLTTSKEDRYVLGMYLATVEHGNRKDARQALNLASTAGMTVNHWTDRLDAEEKAAAAAKDAKKAVRNDIILGAWRIIIHVPKKPDVIINAIFREAGRTNIKSTWRKSGDGRYVLTLPKGGTARLELDPSGEHLKGKTAKGHKVTGLRQAKPRK